MHSTSMDISSFGRAIPRTPISPLIVDKRAFPRTYWVTLDAGIPSCVLARPDIAEIVAAALGYSDGCSYHLKAWCIMPNQVHAVLRMTAGESLARVIGQWKAFTTKRARRVVGSGGAFWKAQHFQRILQTGAQVAAAVDYVLASPRRDRLVNWPWVWSDRLLDTASDPEPMPPMRVHFERCGVRRPASL